MRTPTMEPYVWYDPWEIIKEGIKLFQKAEWVLEEAKELEYNVGRNLNAMAKVHEYDTRYQKQMNVEMLNKLTALDLSGYMNPRIVLK